MITCRDIKGLCRIREMLPERMKNRTVGRPTKAEQEDYLAKVEKANREYILKEEQDQAKRKEKLKEKLAEL